jgi:hypothetical protein
VSWIKAFKNSTTGNFQVTLACRGGSNNVVIPQGTTAWFWSPDGLLIYSIGSIGSFLAAQSVVYRPGATGVLPANVFPTWTGAYNAATGIAGPVSIAVDDSITTPAPVDAGGWDMLGRIYVEQGNPAGSSVLDIPATAQLQNLPGIIGDMTVQGTPTNPALASILYTGATRTLVMTEGATLGFTGAPTRPLVDVGTAGAATLLTLICQIAGLAATAGAGTQIFNVVAAASELFADLQTTIISGPADNVLAGAGAVVWNRDFASDAPIAAAAFTGALSIVLEQGPRNAQVARLNGAGNLVIDAAAASGSGFFNEDIYVLPAGVNTSIVTLPLSSLPVNIGRRIRIIAAADAHINTILLQLASAADTLQGVVNGTKSLLGVLGTIWLIETNGVDGWFVSICAAV